MKLQTSLFIPVLLFSLVIGVFGIYILLELEKMKPKYLLDECCDMEKSLECKQFAKSTDILV